MQPIHIFSDVICPWCFVGKARLDTALREAGLEPESSVVWHAFELDPETPVAGKDRRAYLRSRFGDPQALADMEARLNALAAEAGLRGFDVGKAERIPNTFQAHRLIAWAQGQGKAHALSQALFEANFMDGEDVGNPAVLVQRAGKAGLPGAQAAALLAGGEGVEALRQELDQAYGLGIRGVPFYLAGERTLQGAQPLEAFREFVAAARRG